MFHILFKCPTMLCNLRPMHLIKAMKKVMGGLEKGWGNLFKG